MWRIIQIKSTKDAKKHPCFIKAHSTRSSILTIGDTYQSKLWINMNKKIIWMNQIFNPINNARFELDVMKPCGVGILPILFKLFGKLGWKSPHCSGYCKINQNGAMFIV